MTAPEAPLTRVRSRARTILRCAAWVAGTLVVAWLLFANLTLLRPPRDLAVAPVHTLERDGRGTLHYGRSYARRHGGVWELGLAGDPVELGDSNARLMSDAMFRVESRMMALFAHYVPSAFLRYVITTIVRAQHFRLDHNYPAERRDEIAAEARALAPTDPFASFLPTYHRMITLHALYDISLSFEHSPLLGCTALFASGASSRDGHTYVGRNFDMEIDPVFDTEKTVVLYRPHGRIPFASVAWPGLTGVVTGMNLEGIFVAVHGARARSASTHGVPVPTTLRTVLERAHTLDEAVALVAHDAPMVSHLVFIVDGDHGTAAVVERAPGVRPFVRRLSRRGGLANHFVSPELANDPSNLAVRDHSSTLARQARVDELVAADDGRFDAPTMLAALRDHRGLGDRTLPWGHRGTMDAWIATHSVIADATDRVLWVSNGPHTLGSYERFDLRTLLASEYEPETEVHGEALPADAAALDGRYARWERLHRALGEAEGLLGRRHADEALACLDRARAEFAEPDMDAMHLRARVLGALGRQEEAREAWRAWLLAEPPSPDERRAADVARGAQ